MENRIKFVYIDEIILVVQLSWTNMYNNTSETVWVCQMWMLKTGAMGSNY